MPVTERSNRRFRGRAAFRIRMLWRLLPALIALTALAPVVAAQPATPAATATMTVTGTDSLHIRACPETACDVIATMPLGASVEATGPEVDGFAPVRWQGHDGWAYALYLAADDVPLVRQGVSGCDRVALIFNAGIGETPSEAILDTLAASQRPATLFAMGWWAEAHPGYLRRMASEANVAVGSHGDTQRMLTGATDAEIVAEVRDSAATIATVLGTPPIPYYTPYATDSDARVQRLIAQQGYLPVGWTAAGADFHDDDTAQGVYNRVMDGAMDGAIIELHLDGPSTERSTAQALPTIIRDLEARGYQLVTVPDILMPCG